MYAKQIVHSDQLCHRKIQAVSNRTSVVFESNLTFRNYSKIRMWIQNMDLALDDQVQKVQQLLLAGKRAIWDGAMLELSQSA
ncbi:hypothetical protein T02_5880 [Trichinella nativa]|uniref:Uncharacterized protein n=1 Tax=Trichinella nativa TaxID=6335 RepID=A0A0V1KPN7_9BILA|nr:hypothetical protein T02_5880 [Trichinella nativa]